MRFTLADEKVCIRLSSCMDLQKEKENLPRVFFSQEDIKSTNSKEIKC